MKKLLFAGCLAVFTLFLPSRCPAVPTDVPYFSTVNGVVSGGVTLSTNTFPNSTYGWCINHLVVSAPSAAVVTMFYSTAPATQVGVFGTTNYAVIVATAVPYDTQWGYRTPYCAPAGDLLTIQSSVATSTITYEGYSFRGWNP